MAELVWTCGVCKLAIGDGEGILEIDRVDVDTAKRGSKMLSSGSNSDPTGDPKEVEPFPTWNLEDLDLLAAPARWQAHHRPCSPVVSELYYIPVEGLRTSADVLNWTAHLWEKGDWVLLTDWDQVLRRAARTFK